jgi:truncated hemoglobin YjbI
MNGWIESGDYKVEKNERFNKAYELIKEELKAIDKVVGEFYKHVKAGNAQGNVSDIVKILEAQKK